MTGNPMDFSPLVTLIGAVVTEVIGFAVYAVKATKENTANGITYMMAQQSLNNNKSNPAKENTVDENKLLALNKLHHPHILFITEKQ